MAVKALKGFKDILPEETVVWQQVERVARDIFHRYGYAEIRVPILEQTELFVRSIGEATDIVEKEMYTFTDRNGTRVTLRPEGTAVVLRSFVENGMHVRQPVQKLYTIGPMFRHERPQKGRLRQFHQLSAEVLGSDNPLLDAEVMAAAWTLLQELGVSVSLEINSLGCPACRPQFKEKLIAFLDAYRGVMCDDCERRRDTNPLRVLDCKNEACREKCSRAPSIIDNLCPACAEHFTKTRAGLELLAVPYRLNPFMVRGLDYYTRTTFELVTDQLGAQSAVGAGGRYDGLVKQLDGPDLPGIGFAVGMERLVLLMQQSGSAPVAADLDLFVAALGDSAAAAAFALLQQLRRHGLRAAMDLDGKSLKNQMKQASRAGAAHTLIIGEDELRQGKVVLRAMADGSQRTIELGEAQQWPAAVIAAIRK
ncbi:MAG: histidine--tRNA ligase [Thermodesulfobacteriota bacterium]